MPPSRSSNPQSSENEPNEQGRFCAAFERRVHQELQVDGPVLVGVSGGADSMALAAAAHRAGIRILIGTVDHGVRAESAGEAEQVAGWARGAGVPVHVRQLALTAGPGLEARARAARTEALRSLADELGARWIATAHTATDQAETVLMRLTRGSALAGAAGIRRVREDGFVRPLLWATRADTERYAAANGLPVVRDPMNGDRSFLRVRLRLDVLPALEAAVGSHAVPALARFASFAAEDDAWLLAEAERALGRCLVHEGLDRLAVSSLGPPIRRRVLALWFTSLGLPVDAHHLTDALCALEEGRNATLPDDRRLVVNRSTLTVSAAPPRLHGTSSSDDGRGAR